MHFNLSEFKCSCGCNENRIKDHLVTRLETARLHANIPFVITSGYRCPAHNKAIGGSKTSSHMLGLAVDILAPSASAKWAIVEALIGAGFRRIGIADDFIHVDYDTNKNFKRLWTY